MLASLTHAKFAYTTRNVDRSRITGLLTGPRSPRSGDLVLARVERLGQHRRIEQPDGRRAVLFAGDEIVVCYGDRYAPDQFEAVVPADLGPCHLAAAGGVAAEVTSLHEAMDEPTRIVPLGLLAGQDGRALNLSAFTLPAPAVPLRRPPVVAVVGTSMNAGKTTAAANVIRGLAAAGLRVGAAKVTGTGAGGDRWLMHDAGATWAMDFTDCGVPTTYRLPHEQVQEVATTLVHDLAARGAEAVVIEVADGVFQRETERLLVSSALRGLVDAYVFAAGDAAGAATGVAWLKERALPIALVAGALTRSPLAMREAAAATDMPVLHSEALADPDALLGAVGIVEIDAPHAEPVLVAV
jgi:hypothetical protein